MQNLSDKELDELMKKANEAQSYSYDADSWAALADKLDKTPKRGFGGRQATLVLVVVGVVLMSALYYTVSKQTPISDNAVSSMVPEKEKMSAQESSHAEKVMQTPAAAADKSTQVTDGWNSNSKKNGFREILAYQEQEESSRESKQSNKPTNTKDEESNESLLQPKVVAAQFEEESQRASPVSASVKPVSTNFLEEEAIADSVTAEKVMAAEIKNGLNVKDSVEEKKDEPIRTSRFAIKLSVSPDFSSESFSKTDAVGWNYGGAVEYKISKTFAVSAGLLNTRKYYTAEDVTYGQYTAEFAEGDCRMWDIPVNVYYYFPSRQSLQLIGSFGFSSYIMRQENYIYYPDETNKYRKYYSEINNENSEWFKILNVSIAAQLQMSPTIYIQLEPFIKAPLTGLGEGNISLSSFGTFFTVKYQFNSKPTQTNVHQN